MKLDPFIEAKEVAGHSVQNACRLLEVSKSAYYQRRNGTPSQRDVTDAALLEQIKAIHKESKGTYGGRGSTRSSCIATSPVANAR